MSPIVRPEHFMRRQITRNRLRRHSIRQVVRPTLLTGFRGSQITSFGVRSCFSLQIPLYLEADKCCRMVRYQNLRLEGGLLWLDIRSQGETRRKVGIRRTDDLNFTFSSQFESAKQGEVYLEKCNYHECQGVAPESPCIWVSQTIGIYDLLYDNDQWLQQGLSGLKLFNQLSTPKSSMLSELKGDIHLEAHKGLTHEQFYNWHGSCFDELYFDDLLLFLHKIILTNILQNQNISISSLGFQLVMTRRSTSDWLMEREVA